MRVRTNDWQTIVVGRLPLSIKHSSDALVYNNLSATADAVVRWDDCEAISRGAKLPHAHARAHTHTHTHSSRSFQVVRHRCFVFGNASSKLTIFTIYRDGSGFHAKRNRKTVPIKFREKYFFSEIFSCQQHHYEIGDGYRLNRGFLDVNSEFHGVIVIF